MTKEIKNLPDNLSGLSGAGGGGKGGGRGSPPSEVKDNRFSTVIARVLIAYSNGTTGGLIDGDKSIFLNETQLQSNGGSYNFQGVTTTESDGTGLAGASTNVVNSFEQVRSTVNVNSELEKGTPIVRTVSDIDVDAVRIIITVPSLQRVETDGDIKNTSVKLKFEVRDPASGVWENRGTKTISGKSSGPFQRAFTINEPATKTAAWDWRVSRITNDSVSSRLNNNTTVQSAVEIFYGNEEYTDTALVGLQFNTGDFGNSLPQISFEVAGVKVKVPSNYSLVSGIPSYNGVWDGTFRVDVTSNPVWHIYHLLTDDTIGLGLPESFIDRYNFYEAARYCDAVNESGTFVGVDDGNGGARRRFTFNTQITGQKDGIELMQDIASSCRSILYFGAGAVVLKQDAPRSTSMIVGNENVKDGIFAYSSTSAKDRITVAKVSWNDPDDFFKLRYTVYPEPSDWSTDTDIATFGRNEVEVAKLGCTSEAEAFTFAKWIVYSSINENRTVTFTGGPEFILARPGEVIEIADRRLAGAGSNAQRYSGRIAGGTTTTVDLDYPVELSDGETYQISIYDDDGKTIETRDITTSAAEDVTSVTVDSAFSNTPTVGYTWLITGSDIAPVKFQILNVERNQGLETEIFAVLYDENKYSNVENGTSLVPKPYTKLAVNDIEPPSDMTFQLAPFNDGNGTMRNNLIVRWSASPSELVSRYKVLWRKDGAPFTETTPTDFNEYTIENITPGTFDVLVRGVNPLGYESPSLSGEYTHTYEDANYDWEGNAVVIEPPTITSGASFVGRELKVTWTRDEDNDQPGIVFRDYIVDFVVDSVIEKTIVTTGLQAVYTYEEMVADQGDSPARQLTVNVRERDSLLRESADATQIVTNPTPSLQTFSVKSGYGSNTVNITIDGDRDIAGYYVFRSDTTGFTADASSVVYKGRGSSFVDSDLADDTEYFYRVAAYDLFDDTIANLNISGELSSTTLAIEVDIVEYEFDGIVVTEASDVVSWTAGTAYVRQGDDTPATVSTTSGSDTWTSGTLYVYYDPVAEDIDSGTDLAAILTVGGGVRVIAAYDGTTLRDGIESPIIDGANIIAGTVGATQVVSSGLITNSAQINNAVIESANIGDLQVERIKIANGSITDLESFEYAISPSITLNDVSNTNQYPSDFTNYLAIPTDENLIPDFLLINRWGISSSVLGFNFGNNTGVINWSDRALIEYYDPSFSYIGNVTTYITNRYNAVFNSVGGARVNQEVRVASRAGVQFLPSGYLIPRYLGGTDRFLPGGFLAFFGGYQQYASDSAVYRSVEASEFSLVLTKVFK